MYFNHNDVKVFYIYKTKRLKARRYNCSKYFYSCFDFFEKLI